MRALFLIFFKSLINSKDLELDPEPDLDPQFRIRGSGSTYYAIIYVFHTQGFYMKTGVLGAGGHFVTSPEIREYAKSIQMCTVLLSLIQIFP